MYLAAEQKPGVIEDRMAERRMVVSYSFIAAPGWLLALRFSIPIVRTPFNAYI